MKRLTITLALASIATSAFAAPKTFSIDPAHTALHFEYRRLGFSNQIALFDKINGQIVLDCEAKTGSVDVTIDAKSVNSGYPLLDEYIQSGDFFDTAKYQTITFKSTTKKFDCDKPGEIEGNLTVKGVTKPASMVVTSFQAMPNQTNSIGANAVAKFNRSSFNMGKYAPLISDDVTLLIDMKAVKQ